MKEKSGGRNKCHITDIVKAYINVHLVILNEVPK
jgi:hypothetical protein